MYYMLTIIKFLEWGIRLLKIIVYILILGLFAFIFLKFKEVVFFLDSLNISFYIKKYELNSIASGVITGFITFASMLFIDTQNQKRWQSQEYLKKECSLSTEYYNLLNSLVDYYEKLPIKHGGLHFSTNKKIPLILKEGSDIINKLSNLHCDRACYYKKNNYDDYLNKLYLYNSLKNTFNVFISEKNNPRLKVEINKQKKNKSYHISNFMEKHQELSSFSVEYVIKTLNKEICSISKRFQC